MARNSILWKFEDRKGTSVFLLGTIHLNSSNIRFRKEELLNIIHTVDAVYTETELDMLSTSEFRDQFLLPDEKCIDDYVTDKHFVRWNDSVRKFTGIDMDSLSRLQPMLILNVIAQRLLMDDGYISPDEFVHNAAHEHRIPIRGLESPMEQLETFRQIDLEYQLIMLKRFLSDLSGSRKGLEHQISLYNQQKIHQLYTSTKKSLGKIKDLMLFRRNNIMSERIIHSTSGSKILVAVGAAHLSGGKGILHLCHQKGMTFSPA